MNIAQIIALVAELAQLIEQYGLPLVQQAVAEFQGDKVLPAAQLLTQIATRIAQAKGIDQQVEASS